jgi:hypothetical protein
LAGRPAADADEIVIELGGVHAGERTVWGAGREVWVRNCCVAVTCAMTPVSRMIR